MNQLGESINFIDESDKNCKICVDEYFTQFLVKKTENLKKINLKDLKSARILTKEHDEQQYPIGFRITLELENKQSIHEYLLHESASKSDMIWLKSLRLMFDLIFTSGS